MVFLIKASILIFVLWAFYKLLLERESFFIVNRLYLLVSLGLVFILPFVSLPNLIEHQGVVTTWLEKTDVKNSAAGVKESLDLDFKSIDPVVSAENKPQSTAEMATKGSQSYGYWLVIIYLFGATLLLANLLSQIVSLYLKAWKSKDRIKDLGYTIINVQDENGPRSFFNYIFINPEKHILDTYEQILEHEKIHVRLKHSVDLLLAEIAIVVLWFNPFVWFFRKEVEKNIEYQTDAVLLKSPIIEPKNYQMNLLKIAAVRKPLAIVSNYNQSLIKKRIIMMNKKKSNGHSYWKYAFIAPTLLITLLLMNQPYTLQAQEVVEEEYNDRSEDNNYENDFDDDLKPLLRAVRKGDYSATKKMLENGGDANLMQRGEGTPLTMAIQSEQFKIARLLLENGADPNLGTDSDGYPLWMAARKGNIELVRLLISQGADINTKFHGDGSALIQAAAAGNFEMVKVLVELKADVNMAVDGDGNPLIMASKNGSIEVVTYLVDKGADINQEAPGDETPLIAASEQGHLSIVKFLVEKGADVNKECKEEIRDGSIRVRTALIMAKKKEHKEVLEYLKSKGANR